MRWFREHLYLSLLIYIVFVFLALKYIIPLVDPSPDGRISMLALIVSGVLVIGILVLIQAIYTLKKDEGRQRSGRTGKRTAAVVGGEITAYSTSMCANHPFTYAVVGCASCGKPLCAECKQEVDKEIYCPDCAAKLKGQTTGDNAGGFAGEP
jgi:hypothetical protein